MTPAVLSSGHGALGVVIEAPYTLTPSSRCWWC